MKVNHEMVDHSATFDRFEDSCLSQARLARKIGVSRYVFHAVLHNRYAAPHGDKAQRVYNELRRRGILVEIEDSAAA